MPLTVAEIVRAPNLSLELLAEGDLSRTVRWVHATDQPDPGPYLRGGEVVLTDGLWVGDGTTPVDYVRRLADAGAVAIGFGLIEGREPTPPALIRACRRRGLTLFAVPVDVPFMAISELFVDRMIEEHEEPLRRTLDRSERFLQAVAAENGTEQVLAVLRSELGVDVAIWDRASGEETGWTRFPVQGPSGVEARLGVRRSRRSLTVDEQTAIQQALTVLSLDLAHREALRQTHRRFAAELFDLAREAEAQSAAIEQRLHDLGLDPDGGLVAIMCDRPDADDWLGRFEDALGAAGLRAVATTRAGRLVAVAEWATDATPESVAAGLTAAMGEQAAVGIGAVVSHCALLDASVADARPACRRARLRQDDRHAAVAGELTSHTGLLAQQDPDLLEHFRNALLGPLEQHDAAHGSELVATLAAFISSGGRWAATADELHVHVNTLRHRLARAEALTRRRLDDADDRVDLHLALRVRARADRS
jgi:hypothetical protein